MIPAGGEYVIFADHDDSYVENAFEVMYDKINENDMLISNFNQVFDDKVVKFKSLYKDTPTVRVKNINEDRNLLKIPAAIWTRLFRKYHNKRKIQPHYKEHQVFYKEGFRKDVNIR